MNPENAAVAAGYSVKYARAKSYRIERSAKVGMADAFERAGFTDKFIVDYALKGMESIKLTEMGVAPDNTARHKYFETSLKLTDKLRDKLEHSGEITQKVVMEKVVVGNRIMEYNLG